MTIRFLFLLAVLGGLAPLPPARAAEAETTGAFGSDTNPGAALIGIFYDLKQTQKRTSLDPKYLETYNAFLKSGWDENLLNRFFRATRPLYATQVFVPNMGAAAAPAAFGVKDVVRPTQWIIIYKGQVSPPEDGTYRFVGVCDDIMAVAVGGKTVLVSNFGDGGQSPVWKDPDPKSAIPGGPYTMQRSSWFNARKGKAIDLDVLIGEYPGNLFGAWLMIEKQGVQYPVIDDPVYGKRTVLPLFQLAKQAVSAPPQPVPFSTDGPIWTSHQ